MKLFFKSFYVKLSIIFLCLLLLMGIVQILMTVDASKSFHTRAGQTLNENLARGMVLDFETQVKNGIDMAAMEDMIHYMMVINPKIEIYLLDSAGKILAFFAEPHKKLQAESVSLAPIEAFIKGNNEALILGDDPRYAGRQKAFSAAPLKIADKDGYLYVIIESEQFDAAAEQNRASFITSTMIRGITVSVLVTGLIGLILFALMTRPIRKMTDVVRDFEKGKLNERIPASGDDELGTLANSFNHMADTIVANMDELKRTDQLRRELVANVSHDLRSPMASIKGYLETILIKEDSIQPEDRRKYLNSVLNISTMLEQLIEQLFELSKLDARQTQPQLEPFSIPDLVQDVVMKFTPLAEKAEIYLTADFPDTLPQAYADIGLIERALSNLIENAIRYTPKSGSVVVRIINNFPQIRLQVADTGCGIQEEELPLIFDRFYRVEKSRARATGGAGLGLAITQKILEVHQSKINVESKVNVGTTFSFSLPAWQPKHNGEMLVAG